MRVGIVGTRGFGVGESHSAAHINYCLGANTGNLLFFNAVRSLFKNDYDYLLKPGGEYIWEESIKQRYDILLCPMANHLSSKILSKEYVSYLEKSEVSILPIGLGVQADFHTDIREFSSAFLAQPHCARFISLLNERAKCVCTRGKTSAEFLLNLGYKNEILSTGCPSGTLSENTDLGTLLADNLKRTIQLVENGKPFIYVHNLPSILKWSSDLLETDQSLIPSATKTMHLFKDKYATNIQQSFIPLEGTEQNFSTNFQGEGRLSSREGHSDSLRFSIFFNLESWAQAVSSASVSVGTRIHGNILAMQLGIPSLLYSHDERVAELAGQVGMPSISLEKLNSLNSLNDLMDCIHFDPIAFNKLRRENARKIMNALVLNGLKPSDKIEILCKP